MPYAQTVGRVNAHGDAKVVLFGFRVGDGRCVVVVQLGVVWKGLEDNTGEGETDDLKKMIFAIKHSRQDPSLSRLYLQARPVEFFFALPVRIPQHGSSTEYQEG